MDKAFFKTNKNLEDDFLEKNEVKIEFFNQKELVISKNIKRKEIRKKITELTKGRTITHILINKIMFSNHKSFLIKKPKRIKEKIITGNLFKFSNIELRFQKK